MPRPGWRRARLLTALTLAPFSPLPGAAAGAAEPEVPRAPASPVLPAELPLAEAVARFRAGGLDLLLADAAALSAEGDLLAAAAVRNPTLSAGAGPTFNYRAAIPGCVGCQDFGAQWSVADNSALFDEITAKRALKVRGAREALVAARLGRVDSERLLLSQLKQAYLLVSINDALLAFRDEVARSLAGTLALNQQRLERGAINQGDLSRIAVQKLEAEQQLAVARQALRLSKVALAFLLGVRGAVPDFRVGRELLDYRVPQAVRTATEEGLVERARALRPDLHAAAHQRRQAELALALTRRQRFPDVSLSVSFSQYGAGLNAASPQNAVLGAQLNLPIFYQLQGEVQHADASLRQAALAEAKTEALVVSDVAGALAALSVARRQVERLLEVELGRARLARDTVQTQFQRGAATLMDFLDAQRGFIAINQEYLADLGSFWAALFQLEQAVGEELS